MVRVAAIGSGGLFTGPDLPPARERLLVTTCNWLLGRDERLPHPAGEWEYPRVQLSRRAEIFWNLGTMLALPGIIRVPRRLGFDGTEISLKPLAA